MTDDEIKAIEEELNYQTPSGDAELGLMLIAALRADRERVKGLEEVAHDCLEYFRVCNIRLSIQLEKIFKKAGYLK